MDNVLSLQLFDADSEAVRGCLSFHSCTSAVSSKVEIQPPSK